LLKEWLGVQVDQTVRQKKGYSSHLCKLEERSGEKKDGFLTERTREIGHVACL